MVGMKIRMRGIVVWSNETPRMDGRAAVLRLGLLDLTRYSSDGGLDPPMCLCHIIGIYHTYHHS